MCHDYTTPLAGVATALDRNFCSHWSREMSKELRGRIFREPTLPVPCSSGPLSGAIASRTGRMGTKLRVETNLVEDRRAAPGSISHPKAANSSVDAKSYRFRRLSTPCTQRSELAGLSEPLAAVDASTHKETANNDHGRRRQRPPPGGVHEGRRQSFRGRALERDHGSAVRRDL